MKRIGVISDTHGLLRPEAVDMLQGSDLIIHAGDIGKQSIVELLSEVAPVSAVRGNVDKGCLKEHYPSDEVLQVEEAFIYVTHILEDLQFDPSASNFQVVVTGHTHRPKIESTEDVLYLNPGSAGPRRFALPITIASLMIEGTTATAEIIELKV